VGEERKLVSRILAVRCHSQIRVICGEIKEVKAMNLKGSAKQEDESSHHPA
jgi:hypothetical protein